MNTKAVWYSGQAKLCILVNSSIAMSKDTILQINGIYCLIFNELFGIFIYPQQIYSI